jgi:acetyl esterase/lipase
MNWADLPQPLRDAAYNNAAAVPESASHNAARRAASATFRAEHATHLDIPYGDGPRQKWDFYPSANPLAPCLVFIHGGYWQMNGREDSATLAEGLFALGWSVAMPGYRLAPEASMASIVGDIMWALDWFAENREQLGINGKVVISGWSAGAHLAVLGLKHPVVHAGLAISGIYDLAPLQTTYINDKLQLTEVEIIRYSPLRQKMAAKPLVIAYGTAELPALVQDSQRLHAERLKARTRSVLMPIEGADHFTILLSLRGPGGALAAAARRLV